LIQDYCNENPEVLLKSNDFKTIEKSMLLSILKRDDLKLDEIDIWNCIILWGRGQNEALEKDISEWSKDDFNKLKVILEDFIPLIRFNEIASVDFYDQIIPYKNVFNKEIYKEIFQYYVTERWQPSLMLQKGPRGKLLSLQMKSLISN